MLGDFLYANESLFTRDIEFIVIFIKSNSLEMNYAVIIIIINDFFFLVVQQSKRLKCTIKHQQRCEK